MHWGGGGHLHQAEEHEEGDDGGVLGVHPQGGQEDRHHPGARVPPPLYTGQFGGHFYHLPAENAPKHRRRWRNISAHLASVCIFILFDMTINVINDRKF